MIELSPQLTAYLVLGFVYALGVIPMCIKEVKNPSPGAVVISFALIALCWPLIALVAWVNLMVGQE